MTTKAHIVTENDEGIRPAGKPDECYYCHQKVGALHDPTCVMVEAERAYVVLLEGLKVGVWTTKEPDHWDLDMRRFHYNEGTWCCSNMKNHGSLFLSAGVTIPWDPENSNNCTLCPKVKLIPIG